MLPIAFAEAVEAVSNHDNREATEVLCTIVITTEVIMLQDNFFILHEELSLARCLFGRT